jgi:anaerobic C4-dicarboxylate transporter DcuB
VFGLFPDLRPQIDGADGSTPISMTVTIQLLMFTASTLILLLCKPKVSEVSGASVFKAGITSAIALFGLAWLTDTFISAHEEQIVDTVGGWVNSAKFIFFLAVFLVCALTTSQSTATRTIVPIGLAAGLSPGLVTGMWAGAFVGIYTLPTNGSQIAAANFDLTGSTKLGTKLIDHSFFIPMLCLALSTAVVGSILGTILY